MESNTIDAIDVHYSELSEKSCCLSCGGALSYSKPEKGEVCVDLGSGRGNDVLRLAEEVGEDGYVYGIDISKGMLEKARKTAKRMGITNAEFKESRLESIPLPDESVDLLISNCTLNHAVDKQAVWNEIYRILKPGGRLVISDIYSLQPVPEQYANDPKAVAECWGGAVERNRYFTQLKNAGFSSVTVLEESDPYKKGEIEVASFTISSVKQKEVSDEITYPKTDCCCQ
jgi:ubiquinone/menaquinone biosynthesis C-methylase UbiE